MAAKNISDSQHQKQECISIINILEIFSGKLDDQTNCYVRIMADSARVVCNVNYMEVFKHEVWQNYLVFGNS